MKLRMKLCLLAGAGAASCDSHIPLYALVDGGDGGPPGETGGVDASEAGDVVESELPKHGPTTHVRFALWAPDAPGIDFCVAPSEGDGDAGPSWQGPLLGRAASEVDGGVGFVFDGGLAGLTFGQASAYIALPAGKYDVRAVAPGSSDCAFGVVGGEGTAVHDFAAGAFTTVGVVGDFTPIGPDPAASFVFLTDDAKAAGHVALRFVSAVSSAPSLDLNIVADGSTSVRTLFRGVAFGTVGDAKETDAGPVDSHGYLTLSALGAGLVVADTDAGMDGGAAYASGEMAAVPKGSALTLAAAGGKSGSGVPPALVLCEDDDSTVHALFSKCTTLQSPAGDAGMDAAPEGGPPGDSSLADGGAGG